MSRENVEIVRWLYEDGYARRNVDAGRDRFADDFRFHSRPEFPGRSTYSLDGLPELWADLEETYTEYRLIPDDFRAVDDYVVVTLSQSARMKGTDARLEMSIYHVWLVENGKVREAWTYTDRQDALEAVGLSE